MNHTDYQDLCAVYALGALDGDDLAQLERHLPECGECRKLVHEYRESATGVGASAGSQKPSTGLKDKIFEEIHRTSKASGPNFRMNWAVAAALLVAVGAGFLALRFANTAENALAQLERDREALQKQQETIKKQNEAITQARKDYDEALKRAKLIEDAVQQLAAEKRHRDDILALLNDPKSVVIDLKGTPDAPNAIGRAIWNDGKVYFSVKDMPALPAGKVYELWAIAEGKPYRAGEYATDAAGSAFGSYTDKSLKGLKGPVTIAFTDEPAGGVDSPTGKVRIAGATQ